MPPKAKKSKSKSQPKDWYCPSCNKRPRNSNGTFMSYSEVYAAKGICGRACAAPKSQSKDWYCPLCNRRPRNSDGTFKSRAEISEVYTGKGLCDRACVALKLCLCLSGIACADHDLNNNTN